MAKNNGKLRNLITETLQEVLMEYFNYGNEFTTELEDIVRRLKAVIDAMDDKAHIEKISSREHNNELGSVTLKQATNMIHNVVLGMKKEKPLMANPNLWDVDYLTALEKGISRSDAYHERMDNKRHHHNI